MGSKLRFDWTHRFNRVHRVYWSYRSAGTSRYSRIKR
jgi:hypothetical protein